jgi:hypothetical protein
MAEFPIPVERLTPSRAVRLTCGSDCGYERDATEEEISLCDALPHCPTCDGGWLEWKYAEADKCPSCGRVGWWETPYDDGSCSRVCHLQAEYAATLKGA